MANFAESGFDRPEKAAVSNSQQNEPRTLLIPLPEAPQLRQPAKMFSRTSHRYCGGKKSSPVLSGSTLLLCGAGEEIDEPTSIE